LQNIYDATPVNRAFLLKFNRPEGEKLNLLVESGVRVHKTSFTREKPKNLPSGFVGKLRKHLRGRRLSLIEQVAFDRVVHLHFGAVEGPVEEEADGGPDRSVFEFHLYFELYAQGNVILCDWEGTVLAMLRGSGIAVLGQLYNPRVNALHLPDVKQLADLSGSIDIKSLTCKQGLLASFSPSMIDSCSVSAGLTKKTTLIPSEKLSLFVAEAHKILNLVALNDFRGFLTVTTEHQSPSPITSSTITDLSRKLDLLDFNPIPVSSFKQSSNATTISLPTFNEAVDLFFTRAEALKSAQQATSVEAEAKSRLATITAEQQARMSGLEAARDLCLRKAQLIEAHFALVQDALNVAQVAVSSGMNWNEFKRLIESERTQPGRRGEIAQAIVALKLERNMVTLRLEDVDLDVRLDASVHANANNYYDLRQQTRAKLERTCAANAEALKSAESKIKASLATVRKQQIAKALNSTRKTFWFEKFAWFTSSDGFLVLAGRDAQQNELLVKRHLRAGDAYVHADIHGAGSIIVKNHLPNASTASLTIPPRTLLEAGTFSICQSRAWEAKILTSSWWVEANQVSKTAPSGEYLSVGSFMIRGKKSYLPPSQLSLSFGFVFVVSEEEKLSRRSERLRIRDTALEHDLTKEQFDRYQVDQIEQDMDELIITTGAVAIDDKKLEVKKKQSAKKEQKKVNITEPLPTCNANEKPSTRGQRRLSKKLQKKYRDQDDEERELRIKLLASAGKKQNQQSTTPKATPAERKERKPEAQKTPKAKETTENEDDPEQTTQESSEFHAIDYFTATPKDDQQYLHALPVCFPTSAFAQARFRIKLIPGNVKKGKAVKAAVALLTGTGACPTGHLRDLMRAVPEMEMINVMPAKVALGVSAHETAKAVRKSSRCKK